MWEDVISQYTDGNYYPDAPITRAQFAAIVVRFAELSPGDISFNDVPENHWAYNYISTAAGFGWVTGVGDGRFEPERNITRAEVSTLVNRMLRRYPDEAYIDAHSGINVFTDVDTRYWAYYNIMETTVQHEYETHDNGEIWRLAD